MKRHSVHLNSADVPEEYVALLAVCFILIFLLKLFLDPETWIGCQGLHGVISQKRGLFISTNVRTSDLTNKIIGLK
jgi:hypothetical protein